MRRHGVVIWDGAFVVGADRVDILLQTIFAAVGSLEAGVEGKEFAAELAWVVEAVGDMGLAVANNS